jgi:hypothetical protein
VQPLETGSGLAEIQFQILNAVMDDVEDVEQIYLAVNYSSFEAGSIQPEHPLRIIIDELILLLLCGYLEAPLFCNLHVPRPLDPLMIHHNWFGPTEGGKLAWAAHKKSPPQTRS